MTEILSQSEIDALLTAISTGQVDTTDYSPKAASKAVKIYDFRRPDKFSKDQIRTLQMMHETFSRLNTTALSAQLRTQVSMHVASVDQLTYEEFLRSIPNPTTLAVVNMDPLAGAAVLEIDPPVSFAVLDRLFGGIGDPSAKTSREMTDIELSVMEGIIVRILGNLREAWSNVMDLRPRLGNIETNPQFAQIVPPNDMVVLVTMETKVGPVEGMTNLCIPFITIESVLERLSAKYWFTAPGPARVNAEMDGLLRARVGVRTHCQFRLTGPGFTLRDISKWKKGRTLRLDRNLPGRRVFSIDGE